MVAEIRWFKSPNLGVVSLRVPKQMSFIVKHHTFVALSLQYIAFTDP